VAIVFLIFNKKRVVYLPIIGSFFEASLAVLTKKIMRDDNLTLKNYLTYIFGAIVLVSLPFIYFFWDMKDEAMDPWNLIIFGVIIFFSIFANLAMFYSLKKRDLVKIEPIRLMQPLFVILSVFFLSFFFEIYSSKMALDNNISKFVLLHKEGIGVYDTEEYNNLSFNFNSQTK